MALISCPECGKKISDRAPHCIHCGCPISTSSEHDNIDKAVNTHKEIFTSQKHTAYINGASNKKSFLIIGSLFLATALIIVFVVMRATNSNGTANKASDSPKTYSSSSSTRKSVSNSNYSLYSESEGESWKSALVITDIYYGQEGSYIVCKGSVQNNGKKTYKYVKVRGAFSDRTGKTIDTDWTYAVGSEGLRPGEKSSFRMSVHAFSNFMMAEATIYEAD